MGLRVKVCEMQFMEDELNVLKKLVDFIDLDEIVDEQGLNANDLLNIETYEEYLHEKLLNKG